MRRTERQRVAVRGRRAEPALLREGYARLSQRPLHILAFLFPLLLFYEIGSAVHLSGSSAGVAETIRAHRLLSDSFAIFGVGGLYLPGILLTVVLLVWHIFTGDPWKLRFKVLGGMFIESVAWAIPLLVLGTIAWELLHGRVVGSNTIQTAMGVSFSAVDGQAAPARTLFERLTIAIGAGLYEELLFRMVAIAALHALLVDVAGMKSRPGAILSVVLSAVMFAVYHDVKMLDGAVDWPLVSFYALAGLYFGVVYITRGFGIVVAVHAFYDMAVLLRQH